MTFTWSYTSLKNFDTCEKRHYHYDVAKDIREPESPQLREGNDLHEAFNLRIKSGTPLPLGCTQHEELLAKIIAAPGVTYSEQKLGLTSAFMPCGFFAKNVWFRAVLDCTKVHDEFAIVLDWKSGKPTSDMTQMQLFAATVFHHLPKVMRVRSALVFVNHDKVEKAEFVREGLPEIWSEILPRVKKLEQARATMTFHPKPSGLCKKYCAVMSCPYQGKGG